MNPFERAARRSCCRRSRPARPRASCRRRSISTGRGRAAARPGARRCRDQRRAGAGQAGAASRRWSWPSCSPPPARARRRRDGRQRRGPASSTCAWRRRFWQRAGHGRLAAGARLRPQRSGPRQAGQCRVLLGQPDRAAACRPWPRHGVRRRAGEPARPCRLRGHARVLRQRRRRPGRALARSLHCATARRWARRSGATSRPGSIPATT